MDADAVRRDMWVAAAAAGAAIVTTLFTEFALSLDVSFWIRVIPLYVYGLYAFTRKGGPYSRYDTPLVWITLAVVSGFGVMSYALIV